MRPCAGWCLDSPEVIGKDAQFMTVGPGDAVFLPASTIVIERTSHAMAVGFRKVLVPGQ